MRVLPEILLTYRWGFSGHSSSNGGSRVEAEWSVKTEIVAFYAHEILTSTTVKHKRLQ